MTLVSFDIDGTLEVGEPPGVVPVALVRTAKRLGIAADFTVLKHRLAELKARFPAAAYYHVGDTDLDARFASDAGFRFVKADAAAHRAWGPELFLD